MSLLPRRNVILHDFDGNVIAGFWQYGSVSWSTFSLWLKSFIQTEQQWAVFDFYETSPNRHGGQRSLDSEIVPTGDYILLREDGSPLPVTLTEERARIRQPTHSDTPARREHYCNRTRERDGKCLVTGQRFATWSPLRAAHIFPRAHVDEWVRKQSHHLVTDTAPASDVGGSSKIDSAKCDHVTK